MGGPVYDYFGDVGELDYFNIGGDVVETIESCVANNAFEDFSFDAKDENDNDYFFECWGFSVLERFGTPRLYLAVKDLEEEGNSWHCAYVVRSANGDWLLVHEGDGQIFNLFKDRMSAIGSETAEEAASGGKTEKKRNGWTLALKIIFFPFWLIWLFIKAVLSLFNIAVGDSSAVKAFKKGYNGDDGEYEEYTFTNDMGCSQTVYSKNGRDFYYSDGSYAGKSNDGGKTIK